MQIIFTPCAKKDLLRIYHFLAADNKAAAGKAVVRLTNSLEPLMQFPLMGEAVDGYAPFHIRRWFVGNYEIHYRVDTALVYVLNIWHHREDRSGTKH